MNNKLQLEASDLLDVTRITSKLKNYGIIELGGSYVYGTMVDEDIDINVIVKENELTFDLRQEVMSMLLSIDNLDGIAMADRFHFKIREGRPKGIWFGPVVWHKEKRWNIDIWFVTQDEPNAHHNLDLHKRMLLINEEQRNIILEIKYQLLVSGKKQKGVTSSEVYKAALDKNITNYEDFINL